MSVRRLDGLQVVRGIAALFVVLLHTMSMLEIPNAYGRGTFHGMFRFGRSGVDIFFVLSGFIIAYVHAVDFGRPERLGAFWRKRLLRIYPLYWVATLGLGLLLVVSPTQSMAERDPLHLLLSLTLLPERQDPVLGVGWSLRHEVLFYFLFCPLLINRVFGIAVVSTWFVLIIAGAILDFAGIQAPFPLGGYLVRFFNIHFFFGMAAAWLVFQVRPWRAGLCAIVGTVAFLLVGLYETVGAPPSTEWQPLTLGYALGATAIIYGLAQLDRAGAIRWPRGLIALGTASYSIYLTHVPVLIVVEYALRLARKLVAIPPSMAFVVCVGVSVMVGVVFCELIEKPLLRWAQGRPKRLAEAASHGS